MQDVTSFTRAQHFSYIVSLITAKLPPLDLSRSRVTMPTNRSSAARLRFGSFELDPSSGQLRKDGSLIKLQPQPFRVLQLLAEHGGAVVTRDEIKSYLWSESTFVDFEHGINFSINQIRASLSDNADKPRFIETLPRRGYRFIAPVEWVNGTHRLPPPPVSNNAGAFRFDTATFTLPTITLAHTSAFESASPSTPLEPVAKFLSKRNWISVVLWCALGLCPIAGLFLFFRMTHPFPYVVHTEQLTQSGRADPWGQITSDGARLFYLEREGDRWHTMETGTSGGESQPLNVPFPNTTIFAISPDGSQLLLAPFISREGNLPLWIMPLVGGAPRRLGDLLVNDATFSPDGKQIAFATMDGLSLTDLTGSNSRKIVDLPGVNWNIAWSPRAPKIRFSHSPANGWVPSIFEVTPQGQTLHPLLGQSSELAGACCGRWTSDGSYYFFNSWRAYQTDLWALKEPPFDISWLRSKPVRLTSGPISYSYALPADHGRVVYAHGGIEHFDVVAVDPKTSLAKPVLPGTSVVDAAFSPDGQWLVYITNGGMWRSRPDGTERVQLATNSAQANIICPRWRPDSKFILYFEHLANGFEQMYVVPADGGSRRAILDAEHTRDRPDWSPDGRSIVFSMIDDTQPRPASERGIYLFDAESGRTTKIPDSEDFFEARWSPDGRYLAGISRDSKLLKLYDIAHQRWSEVARGSLIGLAVWSPEGQYLYFQDILQSGEPLFRFRPKDSSTEPVARFDALLKTVAIRCAFIGFAPDGSLLLRNSGKGGNLYKLELDLP